MNNTIATTYASVVDNRDQALVHLFFHCCLEDNRFTEPEMEDLSAKLVLLGIPPKMNIKEELIGYRRYKPSITDEQIYIRYLFDLIKPVNELALYSYCVELVLDDQFLDAREEALLAKIAEELELEKQEAATINRLVSQRKAVEMQKIF